MPGRNPALDRSATRTLRRAARAARRMALLLGLAACTLLRLWLAVLALAVAIGSVWAIVATLVLLLAGVRLAVLLWPLRIAVFLGALVLWHWPLPVALVIAAPRLFLMLPGLIAAFLASKRHPRPRWGSYRPA